MKSLKQKDDSVVKEAAPTRVRIIVQARKGRGRGASYSAVPGHALVVEVRTVREFRRLWTAVEQLAESGGWRDAPRSADPQLPAATDAAPAGGSESTVTR